MSVAFLLFSAAAAAALLPPPPELVPSWTAPRCDASRPLGGYARLPGAVHTQLYNGSLEHGSYSHGPMLGFDGARLFASWKNDLEDEDSPGERVVYAQSADGVAWTPAAGQPPATLFPNMSTAATPSALFAGPPLYVDGRMYAAASPHQYCLYPAPDFAAGLLLLRRVHPDVPGSLGPIFWSTLAIPKGFELASALNGVTTVAAMDAQVRADVALLTNASAYGAAFMPCAEPSQTGKCEACAGGCQPWAQAPSNIVFERTHLTVGPAADARVGFPQVLLWRTSDHANNTLWASVQQGAGGAWSAVVPTDIPNQPANVNAGALPGGRRYLALNPCPSRDPLVLATSPNGLRWDAAVAVATCADLAPARAACRRRNPGRGTGTGLAYPQVLVLAGAGAPPALQGVWLVWSNNKEDIYVTRADPL